MSDQPPREPPGDEPTEPRADTSLRATLRGVVPRPETSRAGSYVRGLLVRRGMLAETPKIDRYELSRILGEGGMGVVALARDPNFAADVAIKVLDGEFTEEDVEALDEAQRAEWLKQVHREAMLLMAVRGPHVVGVFNAGIVEGFRWLAMEYVEGEDLERWLERAPKPLPWRTIVARFVDAARGLQSVHAAGLVHRDFKPRNAVLDRKRDRVCVIDFGLVVDEAGPDEPTLDGPTPADGTETRRSRPLPPRSSQYRAAGTPMFMSPEQALHGRLDARSDQFSFCLSLYWALYGQMPFEGAPVTASEVCRLARAGLAVRLPRPQPRHADAVPRWLHRLLERGMQFEPDDRFPSMAAIVAELTRDRTRVLRVGGALTGLFSAALAIGVGLVPWAQSRSCAADGGQVGERVEAAREALTTRFGAAVPAALAGFADRWRDRWAASCHDHFQSGAPGMEARQQCLRRQGRELESLVAALDRSGLSPEAALEAARSLGDPAVCDAAGLNRAKPAGEHEREKIAAVEDTIAAARASQWVGDFEAAGVHAAEAVAQAVPIGHAPTLALAHLTAGEVARVRGESEASEASLAAAELEAIAGGDVFVQIRAQHELVRVETLDRFDAAAGERALGQAWARLRAVGWDASPQCTPGVEPDCVLHIRTWAEHQDLQGLAAHLRLQYADAWRAHDDAAEAWRGLASHEDVRRDLARSLLNRGRNAMAQGRRQEALIDYAEARALIEAQGGNHEWVAAQLHNAAMAEHGAGRYAQARADAEDARDLYVTILGPRSRGVAEEESLLAVIALDEGDEAAARAHAERALALVGSAEGAAVSREARQVLAALRKEEGELAEARTSYQSLAEELAAIKGEDARCDEAMVRIEIGRCTEEREAAEVAWARSEALASQSPGCPASIELARARGERAQAEGDHEAALRLFEGVAAEPVLPAAVAAELNWARAQSMVAVGRDPKAARELAIAARNFYRDQTRGERKKKLVDLIDRWLAVHL